VIRTFKQACTDAGIRDMKFHDLRHEAASRLFERGLSPPEVAAISGDKIWSQLKRYTPLKAEDLARKLA
jgi:integrase